MVDCLKVFEEDIIACLCTADPGRLAEDLLENGLLAQADFNTFGPYAAPSELVRYLLIGMYKQLQAHTASGSASGAALYERCFEVLLEHGVSDEVLGHVKRKYYNPGEAKVLQPETAASKHAVSGEALGHVKHPGEAKVLQPETAAPKHAVSGEALGHVKHKYNDPGNVQPDNLHEAAQKHGVSDEVLGHVKKYNHARDAEVLRPDDLSLLGRTAEDHMLGCDSFPTGIVSGPVESSGKNQLPIILQEEHVSVLTDILAKHAHKWHEIGIALNLPRHFLKELQSKQLLIFSAKIALDSLLCEWVSKKHEHAKPPTLENLRAALAGDLVELGNVASNLQQKFNERVNLEGKQPFNAEVLKDLTTSVVEQYHNPLGVPSGTSSETSIRSATSEDMSAVIEECRKVLTDIYLAQPELPEDSWPPVSHTFINLALIKQSDIRDSNEYARYTIQGDMDDVYKDKDSIEYESAFSNLGSGMRLLIEGRPGSGKTTLVHKVSRDWAKGELQLNDVQLLFLVHLRHFFSDPNITLRDMVKYHYPDESTADQIVKFAQKHSGEGLCFILDGLDEYVPKNPSTTIFKLIRRDILPKAVVIVASRPVALAQFRVKATKQVETLGFLKDQIILYVKNYRFSKRDRREELFAYLANHPSVMHMCYLPIHTAMVCYLYDQMGDSLPRTETEMYKTFTCHTLLRAIFRDELETNIFLESVEDLPNNKREIFTQICKLAFEKTKSSLQIMKGSDISFFNMSSCNDYLGLITVDRKAKMCGIESLYTFLHLTFQEYLAAYHVAHLTEVEQIEVINECGGEENMQVMWKFFCGIVDFNNPPSRFDQLLKCARDDLFKVQCAFESQQPSTCDSVLQSEKNNRLSFENKFLNPTDFTAIGYVLKNLTCISAVELVLRECKFGEEGIDALCKEAEEKLHLLRTLRYHGGDCSREQFKLALSLIQQIPHLQTLDVTDTIIGTAKTKLFSQFTLPDLCEFELSTSQYNTKVLKRLSKVCGNNFQCIKFDPPCPMPITNSEQRAIFDTLGLPVLIHTICLFPSVNLLGHKLGCSEMLCLSGDLSRCAQLILTGCKLGDREAMILGDSLKNASSLNILNIAFNCVADTGAKDLAKNISHCVNLKVLNMSCNEIGDAGAIAIAEATQDFSNFKCSIWNHRVTKNGTKILQCAYSRTIECTSISVGDDEISLFTSDLGTSPNHYSNLCGLKLCAVKNLSCLVGIKCCTHLQCLTFLTKEAEQCYRIGADGAKAVARSLKHYESLHTLCLNENEIGADGAKALAESLVHCNSLHTLRLNKNEIGAEGAEAFAQNLINWNSLHTLCLDGNGIGPSAITLASNLKHCKYLRRLDLSWNRIEASGAKSLSQNLKYCNSLHTLDLSWNAVGAEGGMALAKYLKQCKSLHVKLSWNGIGSAYAKALALQNLHFDENKIIGTDGASKFFSECKEPWDNLSSLSLSLVGTGGAKTIEEFLKYSNNLHTLKLMFSDSITNYSCFVQSLKCCTCLHTLDLSFTEIDADGAKALAGSLKHCNRLITLCLDGNKFGADGAKAIAEGLKHCNNLCTLHLDENKIGVNGAKALAEGLKHYYSLYTLHLDKNELGADGTKLLADGLKQCHSLHTLHLSGNGIGSGIRALASSLKHCMSLHVLYLIWNRIDTDGAYALAQNLKYCHSLRTLDLSWNAVGAEGGMALAEGLKQCTINLSWNRINFAGRLTLAILNIRFDEIKYYYADGAIQYFEECREHWDELTTLNLTLISADGAKAFAKFLKYSSNLHNLKLVFSGSLNFFHTPVDLNLNKMLVDVVKALAEGLKHCNSLITLCLDGNIFSADGAKALAEGLKHCNSLHTLHLDRNEIGADGAMALAEGLKHCNNLHTLHLDDNAIGADGAQALAEGLKHCHNLHTLHLDWNEIGADGAMALAEGLKHCNSLHTLHLGGNEIYADGAKALYENLKHCDSLHTLRLDWNGISVNCAKIIKRLQHCSLHSEVWLSEVWYI